MKKRLPEEKFPDTIISQPRGLLHWDLKELWSFRELVYFFVWRDIKVRYKQTIMGGLWVVFQPLVAMIIFTLFFGRFAKIPSDNIPYPLFVYVGLLFWNYFAFAISRASESMVANANIIQKIYFPRIIIPLSAAILGIVDFFVASLILVFFFMYYRFLPAASNIWILPWLIVNAFLAAFGMGCLLASLNVKYRDVRYVVPFLVQMLMFVTPVIYPMSMIHSKWKWVFAFNPMSGVIENARAVIFARPVDMNLLFISTIISVFLFLLGTAYFRKTEQFFADLI
jgi:lipopolysaccharide transport system permease protein